VVLTRASVAPPGVASLLDCPVLGTVPDVGGTEPLSTDRVRTAYRAVAAALDADSSAGQGEHAGDDRQRT
jgi:septum site-determining protein MinD